DTTQPLRQRQFFRVGGKKFLPKEKRGGADASFVHICNPQMKHPIASAHCARTVFPERIPNMKPDIRN
ncbi:hypothetical protein, partial [uncultured Desulfovibrio sp.]|uniref:hypothetical protein n=1 Tax=uncultured Desulfovibrio sp. TaxID=167968 RepID=UPI00262FCA67